MRLLLVLLTGCATTFAAGSGLSFSDEEKKTCGGHFGSLLAGVALDAVAVASIAAVGDERAPMAIGILDVAIGTYITIQSCR
jgi:hypothetical protein